MAKIGQIRNEADYDAALARISKLMDALSGPNGQVTDVNHPARVELDALVSQVERYEDEHFPIDPPSLSAAIEFHTGQTGTTPTETHDAAETPSPTAPGKHRECPDHVPGDLLEDVAAARQAVEDYEVTGVDDSTPYSEYRAQRLAKDS